MINSAPLQVNKTLTCAMCGEVFEPEWSDEEARAEAEQNGFDIDECDVVCDPCYQKTPWGAEARA